ncbi:MAG: alanine:cation symporter family protein [Bacteroidaceae bacterium]|nr:alanine:cation symporter family protein [Bacteroidaceae bacterium]
MDWIHDFLTQANGILWGWPMIILLLGTHLFLTIRLKLPQRYIFQAIKLSMKKDVSSSGDVSQLGALATALAATIGTGNIVGVATAVALGGPGAVLWCWLTGVLGIATKYSEALLAVKYRVKDEKTGRTFGGPMLVLERGLHLKWLGIIFAVLTTVTSLGIGCSVQSNSISLLMNETFDIPFVTTGIVLAILAATVLIGGVKVIAKVCTFFVPFMAFFYIVGCLYILCINHEFLGEALILIGKCAFTPTAATGGFIGGGIMIAMRYGIARGLFSNESGLGSAPIVAATAKTRNPVRQALVSASGTFWDTVVICALTGLVIVSSVIAYPDISIDDGATLTKLCFDKIPYVGSPLLAFGILTFAFSTILGWSYYGKSAMWYLFGKKGTTIYLIVYVVCLFIGSIVSLNLIWDIADTMNALMAIPNLISLLFLSGVIVSETRKFLWSNRLDEKEE